jgi:pimeloyl-ACP methyl ester carboxylesterase
MRPVLVGRARGQRRAFTFAYRFPLSGVSIAIAAALVALASGTPARATTTSLTKATPVRGNFAGQIAIGGGRKLYLQCKGRGRPAVILESGIHDSSDPWTLTQTEPPVPSSPAVFSGVARFTRVCRYDRPGTIRYTDPPALTARSTPVKMPRTLPELATDLRKLLRRSGIRGPYTLVGHSFGGMIVRLFAQTYPSKVAGLVLVDAFGTNIRNLFGPDLWPAYVDLLNHPGTPWDSDPTFETFVVDGAIDAVLQGRALPRLPLAVMSKTEPFGTAPGVSPVLLSKLEEAWPLVQDELVKLEPQTPHILATGSDHYVQMHDPDLTIATIRLIVKRVRRGR